MEYFYDILNEVASKLTENGRVELVVTLFVVGSCVSLVSACAFAAAGRVRPSLFVVFFIGGLAVGHYFLSSLLPVPESFLHEEKLFNAVSSFVLFFALIALYAVFLMLLGLSQGEKRSKKTGEEDCESFCGRTKRLSGRVEEFALPVFKIETRKLDEVKKYAAINFKSIKEIISETEENCPDIVREKLKEIKAKTDGFSGVCDAPVAVFNEFLPVLLKTWAKYACLAS